MNPENIINVNLVIADRTYPIKVKASEESLVREAAKQINAKVKEFQGIYGGKDKQDFLAMAILIFAVDTLKNNKEPAQAITEGLNNKLEKLEAILSTIPFED